MDDRTEKTDSNDVERRRRFLREAARGSVPLLVDWISGRPGVDEPAERPRTSPPPQAEEEAGADAMDALERHYQQFLRDNSGPTSHGGPPGKRDED